jgi:hypothetical protein
MGKTVKVNRIDQSNMTAFSALAQAVMEQYQSTELWRCEVMVGKETFEACSEGSLGQVEGKMRGKLSARRTALLEQLAIIDEAMRQLDEEV